MKDLKNNNEREKKIEAAKNIIAGTVFGTAIGITAGLMLAPQSGRETRGVIVEKSKEIAENLRQEKEV